MNWSDVFKIVSSALLSVGTATAIFFGLSSWFGKLWADRILESSKTKYQKELESLKNSYQKELAQLQSDLSIYEEKYLVTYRDKIELYLSAANPIVDLINDIEDNTYTKDSLTDFNRQRLYIYAQLAIFAPLDVLDAYDELVDYLFDCLDQSNNFDWQQVRKLGLKILDRMRSDIGMSTGNIEYKGQR